VQELGGIGAPTFQVLDPEGKAVAILWGHDRLNIVTDLLCGWRVIEERETEGRKRHGRNQKRLLRGEWATRRMVNNRFKHNNMDSSTTT
jgi:hypothetical protein